MIVTTLDTFTSLLGGFTIFGILGSLAYNVGEKDITKVISSGGTALAFISYPEAISKFNVVPQVNINCFIIPRSLSKNTFCSFSQFCSSSCFSFSGLEAPLGCNQVS